MAHVVDVTETTRKPVIVAMSEPPAVEGGAAGKCALALLAGLREHGREVLPVAARRTGQQDPPTDSGVTVIDMAEDRSRVAINVARLRRPRGDIARGAFADQVRAIESRAGLLHLEKVETARLAEGTRLPVVIHLHHLVRADRDPGRPWSSEFREVMEFAAAERWAARRPVAFQASSPVVADFLRRHQPHARIALAPLALLPQQYRRAALDGPPTAAIIGTGGWSPTANALQRLVERVWPAVRRAVPEARLRIAGRGVAELPFLRAGQPGVEVVGEVASAVEFLAASSLLLYPLTRGSGGKVKVLEALASGLPVVTTACGAEGAATGDGMIVSEDDATLARAAIALLEDPLERAQRGAAAHAQFLRQHAPAVATEPLVALYDDLAG